MRHPLAIEGESAGQTPESYAWYRDTRSGYVFQFHWAFGNQNGNFVELLNPCRYIGSRVIYRSIIVQWPSFLRHWQAGRFVETAEPARPGYLF